MLQELLYGRINVLTKPSVDGFGDEKSKADPLKTVLGLAIAGFVALGQTWRQRALWRRCGSISRTWLGCQHY